MKRIAIVIAAVVLANSVELPNTPLALLSAQDRVAEVLEQAKNALGGDKLAAVKAISAEGPFRRTMGQRDMEGTIFFTIARPDKLRRSEEMSMGGMVGGPTVERTSAFNGTEAWDDVQNRGGMGGGMRMEIRNGPGPGGPQTPGPGPGRRPRHSGHSYRPPTGGRPMGGRYPAPPAAVQGNAGRAARLARAARPGVD